jgi:hypothetical protein
MMMLIHALAFILYLVVVVVYYSYTLNYLLTNADAKALKKMYEAWIVCEIFNVIS